MKTIDQRQNRLACLEESTAPAIEGFLGGIISNIEELNRLSEIRREMYGLPLLFTSVSGFDFGDIIDEENLPNDLWMDRKNVKNRNEHFYEYFIKEDKLDDDEKE